MLTAFDGMPFATPRAKPLPSLLFLHFCPHVEVCRNARGDRMLLDHTGLSSSGSRVLAERLVLFDPFIGLLLGRRDLRT